MEIFGRVVAIDMNATVKGQNGTYKGAEIIYKDNSTGETKTKPFHENVLKYNAALKNGLENLSSGDEFTAVLESKEKDGKTFWNWISVSKGHTSSIPSKGTTNSSTPTKAAPSTYATPEERAQTQKYIVRQSSLTAALKLLELHGNKKATTRDVISLAQEFEAYVLDLAPKEMTNLGSVEDMDDDIPF